jgi:hypothetical protein
MIAGPATIFLAGDNDLPEIHVPGLTFISKYLIFVPSFHQIACASKPTVK